MFLLVDEERPGQLVDAVDRHHLDAFGAFGAFGEVARDDDAAEAQPRRLADALLGAGGGAHLTRKPDFARAADALADRTVVVRRNYGGDDGQIQPRIGDLEAAREVEEDVLGVHLHPHALLQHGQ